MIFHKQRYRHRPELGEFGDCHRTAIACLLDLEPEDVPNFGVWYDEAVHGSRFEDECAKFLESHGFVAIEIAYTGDLDSVLESIAAINPGVHYLLAGQSRNGVNHSVVCKGGHIVWDPSLDDAGIVGPCKPNGYYWVTWLVSTRFTETPTIHPELALRAEVDRLNAIINEPHTDNFWKSASIEKEHQRQRWGDAHDRGKSAENWFWLVGYLAGKALRCVITSDREKALHHTISSAAALANWHDAIARDATGTGIGRDLDLKPVELARFEKDGT